MPRYLHLTLTIIAALAGAIGCGGVSLSTSTGTSSNDAADTKALCANILDDAKDGVIETSSAFVANVNYTTTLIDQDDDGSIDRFDECEMTSAGNPKICVYQSFDAAGTVSDSTTHTYSYNADGTLLETTMDSGDGAPITTRYTYTAAGQVASITAGASVTRYTYSAAGYPERMENDSDGDGVLDFVETRTYDTHGNLTQYQTDSPSSDFDVLDMLVTYQHSYDTNGHILSTIFTSDAEESVTWTYDAAGYIRAQGVDANHDGHDDIVGNYTVDADGRVHVVEPVNESIDPVTATVVTNTDHSINSTTFDIGADGTIDSRTISLNGQCSLE